MNILELAEMEKLRILIKKKSVEIFFVCVETTKPLFFAGEREK